VALFVRGLRYRRGVAALLVAVASVASGTGVAAVGYRNAAAVSALRARLAGAPAGDSGVEVSGAASPRTEWDADLRAFVPRMPFAGPRTLRAVIVASLTAAGGRASDVQLEWRQGYCRHVRFSQGRCPRGDHEAAVPAETAGALRWRAGTILRASEFNPNPAQGEVSVNGSSVPSGTDRGPPVRYYRVVGAYTVPSPEDAYWMGTAPGAAAFLADGTPTRPLSVLLDRPAFAAMPHNLLAQVALDQPLHPAGLTLADVPKLRAGVRAVSTAADEFSDPNSSQGRLTMSTRLPQLLDADAADRAALDGIVRIAAAQLLGLVALVLFVVLALAVRSRRVELARAALRGRRPLRTALALSVEPALLLGLALALGVLAAPAVVAAASVAWLGPGTAVGLPAAGIVAAVVIVLGGFLAVLVTALRAALRPAAEHLALSQPEPARATAWWETAALTVAAGSLIELVVAGGLRDRATPWALVAPALCGLAAGLVLARAVPWVLRPLLRRTEGTRHLSVFLLVRELRRDGAAWRVAAVVALAVSLLSFAVAIERGAASDRRDRAGLLVGADRVVSVTTANAASLTGVVSRLDPSGQWAMPAVQVAPFGGEDLRVLAVDAPRLPTVAGWSRPIAGSPAVALARALQPTPPTPFRVTARTLALTLRVDRLDSRVPLRLAVTLAAPDGTVRVLPGLRLARGSAVYRWVTPGCVSSPGCRLLAVSVQRPRGAVGEYRLDLLIFGLRSAAEWTAGDQPATSPPETAGALRLAGRFTYPDRPRLLRRERPATIPAISAGNPGYVIGLDGKDLPVARVAAATVLPRLLQAGTLVDLDYAELAATGGDPGTTLVEQQIWLSTRAPADVVTRLRHLGVTVLNVDSRSRRLATLNLLGAAAGLNGYLAVAVVAGAVAVALLAASAGIAARRRRAEYVALATVGVSRGALLRAWAAAALIRLGFAATAGLASGLGTAHLAASGVPLAAPGAVPPPLLVVPALPAVIATVVTLVPLVAAEAIGLSWSARTAGVRQLREALT
jgi:hypothetical protein